MVGPPSMGLRDTSEDLESIYHKPVGLTITVEKIDRVLAEIQAQIECLRRERTSLRLVRGQLANMNAWRSEG